MDTIAARRPTAGVARTPSAAVLCGVVVAGLVGAACTILLTLTSDHIPEPGVHAGLAVWGILGFVLAGVVAWWRRPESRFGILMVLAGTAWFLATLTSANLAIPSFRPWCSCTWYSRSRTADWSGRSNAHSSPWGTRRPSASI